MELKQGNGFFGLQSINYLMSKLKRFNYEWIVMLDEDDPGILAGP